MGKRSYSRYFFVDYENVNFKGLEYLETLSEDNLVKLYYSASAETLPIDAHLKIVKSKAKFKFIKVTMPLKNSMDCIILMDLYKKASKHPEAEFYIISKDADYDKSIEEHKSNNIKIHKLSNFKVPESVTPKADVPEAVHSQAVSNESVNTVKFIKDDIDREKIRVYIRNRLNDVNTLTMPVDILTSKLVDIIINAKCKADLNNQLQLIVNPELTKEIYGKLKPLVKDLPGSIQKRK